MRPFFLCLNDRKKASPRHVLATTSTVQNPGAQLFLRNENDRFKRAVRAFAVKEVLPRRLLLDAIRINPFLASATINIAGPRSGSVAKHPARK